jgi:hypothetical protein
VNYAWAERIDPELDTPDTWCVKQAWEDSDSDPLSFRTLEQALEFMRGTRWYGLV